MEVLKKYFDELGWSEDQISEFFKDNESVIYAYFKKLIDKKYAENEILNKNINNPALANDPLTANYQTQIDMPKIYESNEKADVDIVHNEVLNFEIDNKQITFKNGKVNEPYDFDFESLNFTEVAEISFEGLAEIGLQYFPHERKIKGTPKEAGDHKITMNFKRKDWTEGKPILQREVVFIINPDPKVLWSKNIPTPKDIEYFKPDSDVAFVGAESNIVAGSASDEVNNSKKSMVAASQRGRSHAIEGKPRDDDFNLYFDSETETYIMVVADGAGSAKYSRKGSQIACNTVMEVCKKKVLSGKELFQKQNKEENKNEIGKFFQETISSAVFEAYKAIEKEALNKNFIVKDFATTLLLSICKKFEYGWFFATWWVGDGCIGIYNKELQKSDILGNPDGGEFAGQTRFLTMQSIVQNELYSRMQFKVVNDFTALVLMTDGITDPKFETDANLGKIEKWNELWDDLNGKNEDKVKVDLRDTNEQVAEQLLSWLNFWSKGNHDDRTIAILF